MQVPRALLRRRMADELENVRNLQMHMGYKLQAIGKKLAKEFNVWNYQLRNRMIQVGYAAAKGALHFVAIISSRLPLQQVRAAAIRPS